MEGGINSLEFHEKLQELRKKKGMTQEELAAKLFVSRTAISKWESGKGYPNIDSLKEISRFFGVSLDALLSGEELLCVAQKDHEGKEQRSRDLVYGLLDSSLVMFLFLPFFGQKVEGVIYEVSLLELTELESYVFIPYLIGTLAIVVTGIMTLALQNVDFPFWKKNKGKLSMTLSVCLTMFFIITLQPYAAAFTFLYLMIKALMLIKRA